MLLSLLTLTHALTLALTLVLILQSVALTLTLLHNPNLVKVYDVLFALAVVLLGRRLSKCPKAQRVLEFVSES